MNKQKLKIARSSAIASIIALSFMTSCQKEDSVEAETTDEAKNHIITDLSDKYKLHTFKLAGGKIANITEDNNGKYFEDDIKVSQEQFNSLNLAAQNQTDPRATQRRNVRKWPGGVIYYTTATLAIHNAVQQAIAEMDPVTGTKHAGIKFVQISYPQPGQNYVAFVPSGVPGSYSDIGMMGGRQEILIASHLNKFVIVHEILHAFGFDHEHTRPDRDQYINMHLYNVNPNSGAALSNWSINSNNIGKGAFDFNSVMIYNSTDFAYPGYYTMTLKDNKTPLVNNWNSWSVKDRYYLRQLYPKYPNQP